MHAFCVSKVCVDRPIWCDFLLKRHVGSVDTRVRVIAAEDAYAGEQGELTWGRRSSDRRKTRPYWCRREAQSYVVCARKVCPLLSSIGGNRTNLTQHVLTRIVNSPTRPKN